MPYTESLNDIHADKLIILSNTGECGYPTPGDEMVTTFGHAEGPWLEGNTISYSCASGLKIAGANTSTCRDNGQWEPDPSDITCTGNHNTVEPMVTAM